MNKASAIIWQAYDLGALSPASFELYDVAKIDGALARKGIKVSQSYIGFVLKCYAKICRLQADNPVAFPLTYGNVEDFQRRGGLFKYTEDMISRMLWIWEKKHAKPNLTIAEEPMEIESMTGVSVERREPVESSVVILEGAEGTKLAVRLDEFEEYVLRFFAFPVIGMNASKKDEYLTQLSSKLRSAVDEMLKEAAHENN